MIKVCLVGIRDTGTVVIRVSDTVAIGVGTTGSVNACARRSVRTLIGSVWYTVVIIIRIARIADTIVISVGLIGVCYTRTVVTRLRSTVTIRVGTTGGVHPRVRWSVRTL